jgi:hypothetical protein
MLAGVIGGGIVLTAMLVGALVWSSSKAAQKDILLDPASSVVPAVPDTASTAPPPSKIAVLVTVNPTDALIGLADGEMQVQPVTVTIGANEEAKIRIEKKGFAPQLVTLKGSEIDPKAAWRVYTLKPLPGTPPVKLPPASRPPAPKTTASALPPPVVKPPPPASGPCEPPRFRDPFDGKCH